MASLDSVGVVDPDRVEASLAALSALEAHYNQSGGLSPISFDTFDSSNVAPPSSPSTSPKHGRHSAGAALSADASDPMGGRSTSTATLEKALALASPNRIPTSSSKGSFRLRLLKAFHAADVQAQNKLELAFESMEQGGSSAYADSSVYSDDTCLLSEESQDESRLAPGEAFAIALLRQARRQRHLARLRERCLELDRQAKYYVKKESEFVDQLEQLFLDKELEISELRSQAQALADDTDHLKEVVAQQAKEGIYLQDQLDAMTTYNTSIEVRVQFIMKQLVEFLGQRTREEGGTDGEDDEEDESIEKWKDIISQIWNDGQENFRAGELRLQLLEKHLEAYRQDNKARAQRLSDRQVKTTGIHQKMCKLQAWILEQHLANSGDRCQAAMASEKHAVATPPAASRSAKASISPSDLIDGATTAPTTESGLPQFDTAARSDKGVSSPSSAPGSLKVTCGAGHSDSPEKDPSATAATIVPLSPPLPIRRHSEGRASRGSTASASASASNDAVSAADLSPPRTPAEKVALVQTYLCEALAAVNFSHQVVRVKNATNIYRFGPEITAAVRLTDDGRLLAARDFGPFRPIREVLLELQADLSANSNACSVASSLVLPAGTQDLGRNGQADARTSAEALPQSCGGGGTGPATSSSSVIATAEAAAAAAAAASAAAVRANSFMMGSYAGSGTGSGSISIPGSSQPCLGPSAIINAAADTGSASNRQLSFTDSCDPHMQSGGASASSSAAPPTTAGTGGTTASRAEARPPRRSSFSQSPPPMHTQAPAEAAGRPPSSDTRNERSKLGYRNTLERTEPLSAAPPPTHPEGLRSPPPMHSSLGADALGEASHSLAVGASSSLGLSAGGSIDLGAARPDLRRSFNNWMSEYVAGQQHWQQLPVQQQQYHEHLQYPRPPTHHQPPLPQHQHYHHNQAPPHQYQQQQQQPLPSLHLQNLPFQHHQQQQQQQQHPHPQPPQQPQYWSLPASSCPPTARRHSSATPPSLHGSGMCYAPTAAGRVDSRRLSLPAAAAAPQESYGKSTSPVPQRICVQRSPVMHTVQLAVPSAQMSARSGTPPMRTHPHQSSERPLSAQRMLRPGAPAGARATFPMVQHSARGALSPGAYPAQSRSPPPMRNSGSTVVAASAQAPARPVPHGARTIRFGSVGSAGRVGPSAGRSPSPPLHTVRGGDNSRSSSPLCTVVEVQPGQRSVVTTGAAARRSSTPPHIGLPQQRLVLESSTDYLSQSVSDSRGSPLLASSAASSVAIASARSTRTALAQMPAPRPGPISLGPGLVGVQRPIQISQSVAQTPPCVSLRGTAHNPQGYILRPAPTIPAIPPSPASSSEVFAV